MSEERVFLTIISQNYVPQARALFESLRSHHPEARHLLCLVEEEADPGLFPDDDVEIVLAKDVVGEGFYTMAYRYGLTELATAVKPFAMRWLIQHGAAEVAYIDPDCFVYSPLSEVFDLLEGGANIVLTPHALEPIDDDHSPGELDLLRTGAYNLGFIAIRDTAETRRFLDWWSDRLSDRCLIDPAAGLFADQKWMDLAPCFFNGVELLRNPGYNVAYWNAFQRRIERLPGGWHVDGTPLRFFHFSGLPTDDVSAISSHQNRLNGAGLGAFLGEFETYLARLAGHALKPGEERGYSYALTWHGKGIDCSAVRKALRKSGAPTPVSYAEFRDERAIGALLESHPSLPPDEMFPISRLLYELWQSQPALADQYPLFSAQGRAAFLLWMLDEGHAVVGLDKNLLPWRALTAPVPEALGTKLSIPPIIWLAWLSDEDLRRSTSFDNDAGFAQILVELQRQISEGERPSWLLPESYLASIVLGHDDTPINVAQYAVWNVRPDLMQAFDLDGAAGRRGLIEWCAGPSPKSEMPWMAPAIKPVAPLSEAAE